MSIGYIYCFSNPSMPGILTIGMTENTPETTLIESNVSDIWRSPTPYKNELSKKVSNAYEKEQSLHILLEQFTERINPNGKFFRVSVEEVRKFFDLMDGEMVNENQAKNGSEQPLTVGTRVRIEGLRFCPELNGRTGVVSNNDNGRYRVDIDSNGGCKREEDILSINLKVVAHNDDQLAFGVSWK